MSWLSPGFPTGSFSYSHGLEWAVESELVKDETTLEMWIRVGLAREFGPVSGYLLRRSWEAVQVRDGNLLLECLSEARAMVASAELELESTAQGDAFYRTISRLGFEWAALKWVKALGGKGRGSGTLFLCGRCRNICRRNSAGYDAYRLLSCNGQQPGVRRVAADAPWPNRRAIHHSPVGAGNH